VSKPHGFGTAVRLFETESRVHKFEFSGTPPFDSPAGGSFAGHNTMDQEIQDWAATLPGSLFKDGAVSGIVRLMSA
jgi:hypothetical protein